MVRLAGVVLPDDKRIGYALTLIYGIGWSKAKEILTLSNIDRNKRVKDLTDGELRELAVVIGKRCKIEGDLREEINENIQRIKEIRCYRGLRHLQGLPVRGQRTRSNARTKRGKRKTVGALKKEDWVKLSQQQQKSKEK